MKINNHNGIILINDILNSEQILIIQKYLNTATFFPEPVKNSFHCQMNDECYSIISEAHNKIKHTIETHYACKIDEEDCATINKYTSGWHLPTHNDSGPTNSGKDATDFSSILYFNNNFTGGQLNFINQNLCIAPEPGMAVISPASDQFIHNVSLLVSGDRYTATVFWRKD